MQEYMPARFSSTFVAEQGADIWSFLNKAENLVRMETATYLSRPAAEPLSPFLLSKFGPQVGKDRVKQMIGHMIRQILEARGYHLDRSNVRITTEGNMFTSATRYKLSA